MRTGVYIIRHTGTWKVYVGSALKMAARFARHLRELTLGLHHSTKLQRAWNKYGARAFVFEVVEEVCDVAELIHREQLWINSLDAYKSGYNECPVAGSRRGATMSVEARARIAQANTGRRMSDFVRAALRA